ncbi:hypothetical protein EYC80_007816 [Monilinia laxa]|uniref:Uncharacterized protein n=1 Tax=Monilinia laxa TaxID=61186 RepID=A0A5N6JXH6_MONLA|nr:hypothetical protein EYC80_007816 [Monilinia laxa]
MASSQKKAVIPGIVEWESSHIDNLVIHELLKLAEQDLKQQKLISRALHSQKYSNVDEKDLLAAIVTDDWIEGVIFRKEGKRYIIEKGKLPAIT